MMALDSSNLPLVPHDQHTFHPSADEVEAALWRVNGKKALGPDAFDGTTLSSGRLVDASLVHKLVERVIECDHVPASWRGGKAADLYKGKGSQPDANNGRMLLIQYHPAKAFVGLLKERLVDDFERDNPGGQFGGVQDSSTDMPSHIMLSCAAQANSLQRSWSFSFLDGWLQ